MAVTKTIGRIRKSVINSPRAVHQLVLLGFALYVIIYVALNPLSAVDTKGRAPLWFFGIACGAPICTSILPKVICDKLLCLRDLTSLSQLRPLGFSMSDAFIAVAPSSGKYGIARLSCLRIHESVRVGSARAMPSSVANRGACVSSLVSPVQASGTKTTRFEDMG